MYEYAEVYLIHQKHLGEDILQQSTVFINCIIVCYDESNLIGLSKYTLKSYLTHFPL